jgi:hypothetical protein
MFSEKSCLLRVFLHALSDLASPYTCWLFIPSCWLLAAAFSALWSAIFFALIPMLDVGTLLFMVSCIASVSLLHVASNSPGVWIREGGPSSFSFSDSALSNSSQSTFLKFLSGFDRALARSKSRVVSIGRWSVLIPGVWESASHEMIASICSSEMNTWSSLNHFLETLCTCVGIPRGNAKSRPSSATAIISVSASHMADLVNSLVSAGSSQRG